MISGMKFEPVVNTLFFCQAGLKIEYFKYDNNSRKGFKLNFVVNVKWQKKKKNNTPE